MLLRVAGASCSAEATRAKRLRRQGTPVIAVIEQSGHEITTQAVYSSVNWASGCPTRRRPGGSEMGSYAALHPNKVVDP